QTPSQFCIVAGDRSSDSSYVLCSLQGQILCGSVERRGNPHNWWRLTSFWGHSQPQPLRRLPRQQLAVVDDIDQDAFEQGGRVGSRQFLDVRQLSLNRSRPFACFIDLAGCAMKILLDPIEHGGELRELRFYGPEQRPHLAG